VDTSEVWHSVLAWQAPEGRVLVFSLAPDRSADFAEERRTIRRAQMLRAQFVPFLRREVGHVSSK
jgi:hypothetical protein